MFEINRTVLVVKPKQPFLAWALSLDDEIKDLTLERLRRDCTAYLVPEIEFDSDQRHVLEWCFTLLFDSLKAGTPNRKIGRRTATLKCFLNGSRLSFTAWSSISAIIRFK